MLGHFRPRRFKGLYRVALVASLLAALVVRALPARAAPLKGLTGSMLTAVNPNPVSAGTFDITFSVAVASPDDEYAERFDIDLPDGWTVNAVTNLPSNTDIFCIPPAPAITIEGVEPGNVVYWQDAAYPNNCGVWTSGKTYNFVANVTVPDGSGAPWSLDWHIYGDGYNAEPHSTSGTYELDFTRLCTSVGSGNWSEAATWDCGHVPHAGEDVVIAGWRTVTLDVDTANLNNVTIETGGELTTSGAAHTLSLQGNWTNDGTFTGASGAVHFRGTTTLSGAGVSSFFDVFVDSGSTLNTGSHAFTVARNFTNAGTFTSASGAVHFTGATTLSGAGVSSFFDIFVDSGSTLNAGSHNFSVARNFTNGGAFTSASSAVHFTGTTTLSGAGVSSFFDIFVDSGSTLNAGSHNFSMARNFTNDGAFTSGSGAVHFTGTTILSGAGVSSFFDVFVDPGSTLNTGSHAFTVARNFTNDGTFTSASGAVHFGGTTTLSGAGVSSFFDVFVDSGSTLNAGSHNFSVAGNFANHGTFNPGAGTVTFNGSGAQTATSYTEGVATYTQTESPPLDIPDNSCPAYTESSLLIAGSRAMSDVNVTINITHTYNRDLQIYLVSPLGTQVELSTNNGSSGSNYVNTVFDDEATTSITAGAAPFTGSYRPEGSLSTLDGENINGTWRLRVCDDADEDTGTINDWSLNFDLSPAATFNNVVVVNGSTLTPGSDLTVNGSLIVDAGGALNMGAHHLAVTGALANNGTLSQQQSVTGSGDVTFFSTGGYGGVTLNANGVDLGNTTVTVKDAPGATCVMGGQNTVGRCFQITPTGAGPFDATVTFFFSSGELNGEPCDSLLIHHYDGSGVWSALAGTYTRQCSVDPYSVQVTGVTAFSPFVLADSVDAPTAITLNTFTAEDRSGFGDLSALLILCLLALGAGGLSLARHKLRKA